MVMIFYNDLQPRSFTWLRMGKIHLHKDEATNYWCTADSYVKHINEDKNECFWKPELANCLLFASFVKSNNDFWNTIYNIIKR